MTRALLLTALLGITAFLASPTPTCQAQGLCVTSRCIASSQCGPSCFCGKSGGTVHGICVLKPR